MKPPRHIQLPVRDMIAEVQRELTKTEVVAYKLPRYRSNRISRENYERQFHRPQPKSQQICKDNSKEEKYRQKIIQLRGALAILNGQLPQGTSVSAILKALLHEQAVRLKLYPKWIKTGKYGMTKAIANRQYSRMNNAIREIQKRGGIWEQGTLL